MTKLLFTRSKRIIFMAALFIGLVAWLGNNNLFAQQDRKVPKLPVLGLGVDDPESKTRGDKAWYPDNRIWSVPSTKTEAKEIVVPVFINNRWFTHPDFKLDFTTEPITSFSFRLYYNDKALQFLGLQNQHPITKEEAKALGITKFNRNNMSNDYTNPLAEHFNLSASDNSVNDYGRYFNSKADETSGRAVTITGIAFNDYVLDTTDFDEQLILLYVRFKVLAEAGENAPEKQSSYLYFDPTYILYNGVNISNDIPAKLLSNYKKLPTGISDVVRNNNFQYWDEDKYTQSLGSRGDVVRTYSVGLRMFTNIDVEQKYENEPYLPGSIIFKAMDDRPEFDFTVENAASSFFKTDQIYREANDRSTWILVDPITTATPMSNNPAAADFVGERLVEVSLSSNGYAMKDIIIETDQEWLKWKTENVRGSSDYKTSVTTSTRRGYIDYIDLIVGRTSENPFSMDPDKQYSADKKIRLGIYCEPETLEGRYGIYTGYITLRSADDKYRPTRIKVTFIYFANPVEYNKTVGTPQPRNAYPYGINLTLTPHNGTDIANSVRLIMGSAERATIYADTLYGEFPYQNKLGRDRYGNPKMFDARFFLDENYYPKPNDPELAKQWEKLVQFGFGDFSQSEAKTYSNSRDIRNLRDTAQSHIYKVKFFWSDSLAHVDYFPVELRWSRDEFPDNTSVFLRTIINGVENVIDLKTEGTPIGGNKFTYTFSDKNVTDFIIEYTIGVENIGGLVDNFGNPLIKADGWNFLSLPLKPVSSYYKYIFKNALNIPFEFTLNSWQQPADGKLRPGVGYFIKYGTAVDKNFTGSYFFEINKNVNPVKLFVGDQGSYGESGGWNAIGGLSVRYPIYDPTGRAGIQLEEVSPQEIPDISYTQKHGVWAYRVHGGYEEVTTLYPGMGYWIKVNKNCYLKLNANTRKSFIDVDAALPNKTAGFDKITIADNAQHVNSIYATTKYADVTNYELPPAPPQPLFDVRFADGNYVTNKTETTVLLQGVTYPISVNIENAKADYSIVDVQSGEVYGTVEAGKTKTIVINNCKANAFKLISKENSQKDVFVNIGPNPILSASAELSFGIAENTNVRIAVYNSLGNEVAVLVDNVFSKGVYNQSANLSNLPSGNYTVKMVAAGESKVCRINIVK